MRNCITLSLALVLGLVCCTRPGYAEDEADYTRSGVYLGISPLHVFEHFDLDVPGGTATVNGNVVGVDLGSSDAWGIAGNVGYRFNSRIAAELQTQYFSEFDIDASLRGPINQNSTIAKIDGFAVSANGKLYFLTGRIQPYGLGGIGFLRLSGDDTLGLGLSDTDTAFAGRIGGGVDLYLTRNVAFNAEVTYLMPTGDLSDFKMVPLSVGLMYRF